jgi:hypothetical protein
VGIYGRVLSSCTFCSLPLPAPHLGQQTAFRHRCRLLLLQQPRHLSIEFEPLSDTRKKRRHVTPRPPTPSADGILRRNRLQRALSRLERAFNSLEDQLNTKRPTPCVRSARACLRCLGRNYFTRTLQRLPCFGMRLMKGQKSGGVGGGREGATS